VQVSLAQSVGAAGHDGRVDVADLPPPRDIEAHVGDLVVELAHLLGEPAVVDLCVELLEGADAHDHLPELAYLTGIAFGDGAHDLDGWGDYWPRSWGARGLLYVWHDSATGAVVAGLGDEHWRPAEMCLKVATRHEVAGTADGAAALSTHELPRVRGQAVRTLAVTGDTEHVDAVRARLADDHESVRRQAARALTRMARRLDLPDLDDLTAGP
jgi:hypothetical protein